MREAVNGRELVAEAEARRDAPIVDIAIASQVMAPATLDIECETFAVVGREEAPSHAVASNGEETTWSAGFEIVVGLGRCGIPIAADGEEVAKGDIVIAMNGGSRKDIRVEHTIVFEPYLIVSVVYNPEGFVGVVGIVKNSRDDIVTVEITEIVGVEVVADDLGSEAGGVVST